MRTAIFLTLFMAGVIAAVAGKVYLDNSREDRFYAGGSYYAGQVCRAACCLPADINLTEEEEAAFTALEKAYCRCKDRLAREIDKRRMEIADMLLQPNPDLDSVDRLVEEIGRLQAELEKETIRHIMAIRSRLEPEDQEQFIKPIAHEMQRRCYHRSRSLAEPDLD